MTNKKLNHCWYCDKNLEGNVDEKCFWWCSYECKSTYENNITTKLKSELKAVQEKENKSNPFSVKKPVEKKATPSPLIEKKAFVSTKPKSKPYSTFKKEANYKCLHKYNCRAHQKICIEQYGISKLGGSNVKS